MAKKSKTQRAKASARRAEKREAVEEVVESQEAEAAAESSTSAAKQILSKDSSKEPVLTKSSTAAQKPKKESRLMTFLQGVRSEMKRVTWPTRTDVIRWSGVVVGALLFFGVFVFILDNIFPQLLILIDSINTTGA